MSHSSTFFPQHSGTNQHPHLKKQKPSTFTDIIGDSLASGAFTPRWLFAPPTSYTSQHIMPEPPRPANLSKSLPDTTLFLTLYALKNGFREGNPFVDLIVDTVLFAKLKLLIVPFLQVFIWIRRKHVGNRLYLYVWIAFLTYLFLVFYYAWLFWSGYL